MYEAKSGAKRDQKPYESRSSEVVRAAAAAAAAQWDYGGGGRARQTFLAAVLITQCTGAPHDIHHIVHRAHHVIHHITYGARHVVHHLMYQCPPPHQSHRVPVLATSSTA